MRRREFITLVGGAALPKLMLMPAAHAEGSSKRPLVVWLAAYPRNPIGSTFFDAFVNGMQDQGYMACDQMAVRYKTPAQLGMSRIVHLMHVHTRTIVDAVPLSAVATDDIEVAFSI